MSIRNMSIELLAIALLVVLGATANASSISGTVTYDGGKASLNGGWVSAQQEGADYTTYVYTDASGRFHFPDYLPKGRYTVAAYAQGFKKSIRAGVIVGTGEPAEVNFSLTVEQNPAALFLQATASEWLNSLPGTKHEKSLVARHCSGCHHNITQVMYHRFTKQGWLDVLRVHNTISSAHAVWGPINEVPWNPPRPEGTWMTNPSGKWIFGTDNDEIATYLAKIQGPHSPVPTIKFRPRPKGKVTRAVITYYRIPRYDAAPHDVQIDKDGNIWYDDFMGPYIGELDPRTGQFTEYKIPFPLGVSPGIDDIWIFPKSSDPDSLWIHARYAHRLYRFNIKTKKITGIYGNAYVSAITANGKFAISPAFGDILNIATGKITHIKFNGPISGYGGAVDSNGVGYRGGVQIGAIRQTKINKDGKTGVVRNFYTGIKVSGPRRGCVDAHNNAWFGDWYTGSFAEFDAKAHKVIEYPTSDPWGAMYEACANMVNGNVWGYDWHGDLMDRLNPHTGKVTEYPMPTLNNESRRTVVDTSTNPPSIWFFSMMEGSIIRLVPYHADKEPGARSGS